MTEPTNTPTPADLANVDLKTVTKLIRDAQTPIELGPQLWATVTASGTIATLDVEKLALAPRRKTGSLRVSEVGSFCRYVRQHGEPDATSIWADQNDNHVKAVLNDHMIGRPLAGWRDHAVHLDLAFSREWREWNAAPDYQKQKPFAEFVENHLTEITRPSASQAITLARTFSANIDATFRSATRLENGDVALAFTKTTTARAGEKGDLEIPETWQLAMPVYEGGAAFPLEARFRYRINSDDGSLTLGLRLDRPDLVQRAAFDAVLEQIQTDTGLVPFLT